jgi:hypothetical protein
VTNAASSKELNAVKQTRKQVNLLKVTLLALDRVNAPWLFENVFFLFVLLV